MKKYLPLAVLFVLALANFCLAQTQATPAPSPSPAAAKPKPRMSKAQLLKKLSASETALWEGWKNKDAKPFQRYLATEAVGIGEDGIGGKEELVKSLPSMPCDVKSYTLSDWKILMVNASTAVLTYKGAAEGTCGGQPIPATWSSSLWVNRNGRWMVFSHQETNIKNP